MADTKSTKTDCVYYKHGIQKGGKEWERCDACKRLYCAEEKCSFYKKSKGE